MSTHARSTTPAIALVRAIAWLVPRDVRAEWIAEWEGELHARWTDHRHAGTAGQRARLALRMRSLGAIADALTLRRRELALPLAPDVRYALRSLSRAPGYVAVVVLTLALGIGANTAIFTVVHGVLLRALPFREPERVLSLIGTPLDGDKEKVGPFFSVLDYHDFVAQARAFRPLAATRFWRPTLTAPHREPTQIEGAEATASFFPTLGVWPARGRAFTAEEERTGAHVVVLSHAFWESRFGGDPAVLGSALTLDAETWTVIGIMPAEFRYPVHANLWIPLQHRAIDEQRGTHTLVVFGRLAPGVSSASAGTEVREIARRLEQQYPADNADRGVRVQPIADTMLGRARPALVVLLAAVALVLLVACSNLANLFLARATSRAREVAVRSALGANRSTLLRHFMVESVLLALAGGALGLLVATWGVRALVAGAPATLPRLDDVRIDLPVLGFLFALSLVVGVIIGTVPALSVVRQLRRGATLDALRDGARGATRDARRGIGRALVVAEVALATMLVIGAGLFVRSFAALTRVDPGFEPSHLLDAEIALPESRYESRDQVRAFARQLRASLQGAPGARGVAIAYQSPVDEGWTTSFTIAGREPPPRGHEPEARMRPVAPGYFRIVGVRLLAGRDIQPSDNVPTAPGVVVVNEAFARRHFPGESAIGHRIERQPWWSEMPASFEIVGVVSDERFMGPRVPSEPATYFPFAHFPMNDFHVLVRTTGAPAAFASTLRQRVWALDPQLPLDDIRPMDQAVDASVADARFTTALVALFALLALVLAALGIYGVLSYTVTQRRGEIGIRMALGARRTSVLRLVVGQGMVLAIAGLAIGVVGAAASTRLLSSLLFGVGAHDPVVFGTVAGLLCAVALLAAYLPARRASRVDPVVALRA